MDLLNVAEIVCYKIRKIYGDQKMHFIHQLNVDKE